MPLFPSPSSSGSTDFAQVQHARGAKGTVPIPDVSGVVAPGFDSFKAHSAMFTDTMSVIDALKASVVGFYKLNQLTHTLKAPGFNHLTYTVCEKLVSRFAFKFNLYRYSVAEELQFKHVKTSELIGGVVQVGFAPFTLFCSQNTD